MIIKIVVFILLAIGILVVLKVDLAGKLRSIKKLKNVRIHIALPKKRPTLKKRLEELRGQKKSSFISQNLEDARHVLATTGKAGQMNATLTICAVCAGIGFFLGLILKMPILCPILTMGFYLVPLWIIKISARNYRRHLSNELSICLSIITPTYLRTENIVKAVEENLPNLHHPVRESFAKFLARVKYVDADIVAALGILRNSIDDPIFYNWCSTLIQCQNDRSLKYSLQPLVQRFSQTKAIQAELETEMMKPLTSFIQMAALAVGLLPLLYMVNKEWFEYLTQTLFGQISMAITVVAILIGVNKAVNLTKPVEVMRGGEKS